MPVSRRVTPAHLLAGVAPLVLTLAFGFTRPAQAEDADPPTRAGRIAFVEGTVSFHANADDPWGAAVLNYPLAPATALWTDPGAHAEVQFGGTRVRMDGGTELDIVQLDDATVSLSVPQGRVDISVWDAAQGETVQVELPRGTVTLDGIGRYRLFAGSPEEATRIGSFDGQITLTRDASTLTIGKGEEAVIGPVAGSQSVAAIVPDAFDQWTGERERVVTAPPTHPAYVSAGIPGAIELDSYGTWNDNPQYQHVWFPKVEAGWAPYRRGHWAYVAPWGYSWIDDAPWGFAPFHYGRWVEISGRWGWVPGEVVARPVYAPALVAFVGNPRPFLSVGVGVGGGVGIGAVAWIPLGPREVWVPPYHTSINYVRNVNVTDVERTQITNINVTNIRNVTYVNQRAVTVVQQDAFAGGKSVREAEIPVRREALVKPIAIEERAQGTAVLPPPKAEARRPDATAPVRAAPPAPKLPVAHPLPASTAVSHGAKPVAPPPVVAHPAAASSATAKEAPAGKETPTAKQPPTAKEPAGPKAAPAKEPPAKETPVKEAAPSTSKPPVATAPVVKPGPVPTVKEPDHPTPPTRPVPPSAKESAPEVKTAPPPKEVAPHPVPKSDPVKDPAPVRAPAVDRPAAPAHATPAPGKETPPKPAPAAKEEPAQRPASARQPAPAQKETPAKQPAPTAKDAPASAKDAAKPDKDKDNNDKKPPQQQQ